MVEAEEAVGNPDRRALVVRRAAAVVAAGEVAGEANGAAANEVNFSKRCW